MKKRFSLAFFILGFASIIAQVLLLREIMVTFYGNEFFLGLALGFWLLWTALGSFLGKKFISQKVFLINLILLVFFLPLSLILIRLLKTFFPIGVLIDFPKAIGLTLFSLAPLGLSLGFFFTTAFAFSKSKKLAQITSQAYLVETLGFAFGGLLFSFWLIQHSPLLLTLALAATILLFASFLTKKKIWFSLPFLLFFLVLCRYPLIEQKINTLQFPGLVKTQNSIYGRVTVTQRANQFHFFESGTLTGISQKIEDIEYLIHPTLLEHPQPKKILMIGGGLDGALGEILKHQPEKVTYVELDPVLVATIKEFLDPELAQVFDDKRIDIVLTDPRKFLKETPKKFDLVIINLPPPSTALINRLYTQEAMTEIKRLLNPNGLLAINLAIPTDYLSQESQNLTTSIYQTIKQQFKNILLLPEYSLLILASNEQVLTTNPELLDQRLKEREIETDFITPAYLENRLTDDRIAMFTRVVVEGGRVNQDFFPIAYFYQAAFWQSYFSPRLANVFLQLSVIGIPLLALALLGLFLLLLWRRQTLPTFLLALTGATIMVWEIILIFAFQVKLGYIYQQISLLLAIILAGMALGNYWASRYLDFKKHLKIILLLMILFTLGLPSVLTKTNQPLIFFLLIGIGGILTGTMFPLIMQGYLKRKRQIGVYYAADLVGSFLGAVLASLFLIPLFGLQVTAYFLAIPLIFILLLQKLGR